MEPSLDSEGERSRQVGLGDGNLNRRNPTFHDDGLLFYERLSPAVPQQPGSWSPPGPLRSRLWPYRPR